MRSPDHPLFDPLADSEIEDEGCADCGEAPMVQGFGSSLEVANTSREEQHMTDFDNGAREPAGPPSAEEYYRALDETLEGVRAQLAGRRAQRAAINDEIRELVDYEERLVRMQRIAKKAQR